MANIQNQTKSLSHDSQDNSAMLVQFDIFLHQFLVYSIVEYWTRYMHSTVYIYIYETLLSKATYFRLYFIFC